MVTCRLWVVGRNNDAVLRQRFRRVFTSIAVSLTLATFGILLSRTLELNGGLWSSLWRDMGLALRVTHFGHIWWWRLPALAAVWILWGWSRARPGQRLAWCLMIPALALIALTRSETGHPADNGDFTVPVWVDWGHILAAGAWVGSIFGMAAVVFPYLLRRSHPVARQAAKDFQRLSTASGIALAVLVACGVYNVTYQLGGIDSLWTTRFGIALSVKLALVLAMIGVGTHNRYFKLVRLRAATGMPPRPAVIGHWLGPKVEKFDSVDAAQTLRSCARAVLYASVFGVAVISVTAVLVQSMPPADMRHVATAPTVHLPPMD